MSILSVEYIEQYFPLIKQLAVNEDTGEYDTSIVELVMEQSETELSKYVKVTAENATDIVKLHLFNIIRYQSFMRVKGDYDFQSSPMIIKDYKASIEELKSMVVPNTEGNSKVTITAKPRRFDEWFNQGY